jgi:N-acetylneuraminic acid mutarotase
MAEKKLLSMLIISCIILSIFATSIPKGASEDTTAQNSWVEKAPMPQARADLGLAVVNGKIYAIGGQVLVHQDSTRTESKVVGTNEEYNPLSDNWAEKAPMPIPSSNFATAVYQGRIYCIGGGVSDFFNSSKGTWETNITQGFNQVYDPTTDKWENKTAAPLPQISALAHLVNGKIYFTNGYPNRNVMQVYDPSTDKWEATIQMPFSAATTSGSFNDKIYFFGNAMTKIYDPQANTWSNGAPPLAGFFKGALGATTGIMAPERAYIFYNPVNAPNSSLYLTQVYDPNNGSWTVGANMLSQRQDFSVAVVDDVIYVIGGYIPSYPNIGSMPQTYGITYTSINEQYYPIEYGNTPPFPVILSPTALSYNENDIPLTFTLSKAALWIGYSLDGKDNVTIDGNTTLTGIPKGIHNITVYASDANGIGASQTVNFTVMSETISLYLIIGVSATTVSITALLILLSIKKTKTRQTHA